MPCSPSCASRLSLALTAAVILLAAAPGVAAPAADYRQLAPAVVEGVWLRPARERPAQPRWGHARGLQVGLHPFPGPRGLLRIYAPYLDQPEEVMINYIAVEPIPLGQEARGLSELEPSKLDQTRGKRFWSADDLTDSTPKGPEAPSRGVVETIDGVETLQVYILVERFDNGAHVALRLAFRADCPHEVGIATYKHDDSIELSRLIVTATMGNYARLRQLHLAGRVASAGELWPEYQGTGFTPHARFPLEEMARTPEGDAIVVATTDEPQSQKAAYAPFTRRHWRYQGQLAAQSWRAAPSPELEALVNGRRVYWASQSPIPGGVSFENFELTAPFQQGGEFWFAVEPVR